VVPNGGARAGNALRARSVRAAFNLGAMIRWLDFNDGFTAAEKGHPSDNLGGLLATADLHQPHARRSGAQPLTSATCWLR